MRLQRLIPLWASFRQLVHAMITQVREVQLFLVASGLAYATILSIIPLLAVSFAIFKSFGGLDRLYETIEPAIIQNLAQGSGQQTVQAIRAFIAKIHTGVLGTGGIIGLFITSMSLLSSAEKSINRIWKTPIKRSVFQRMTSYWFLVSLGPLAIAFTLGAASSDLHVGRVLPRGLVGFLTTLTLFFLINRFVPNRSVRSLPAFYGALFTTVIWDLARWTYTIYSKEFLTYNKIYGSLAAVPLLILWIQIAWVVILLGVALSASLQHVRNTHS